MTYTAEQRQTLREPIPPRPSFSKAMRARVFAAGEGRCYLCGEKIVGVWEIEHVTQREFAGPDPDRFDNLKPAHVECHKPKTKADAKVRGHVRRMRKKADPTTRPKGKPIPSRGFQTDLKRKLDGTTVRRDSND